MRTTHCTAIALALVLYTPAAAATPSEVARELIVSFATRATHRASPPTSALHAPAHLDTTLCASLGLRRIATLDERSARAHAEGSRSAGPLALDPARICLYSAPDSIAAAIALRALRLDPRIEWVEHNAPREAAVWSYDPVTSNARTGPQSARASTSAANSSGAPRPAAPHMGSRPTSARRAQTGDDDFPNDPMYRDGRQWGLGAASASVRALDAWRITTGSNDLVLGIADTGIDSEHPDLGGSMPVGGPRVVPGIDLIEGLDVRDTYGHGTPVAGVMAARTHDGAHFDSLGIAGVCGGDGGQNAGCRILPLKITRDSGGYASSFDIAAAVMAATRLGARAVNLSYTGAAPSRAERLALQEAITHGCVVVAAAGNRGFREGTLPQYPAAYAADGLCIQVGASDAMGRRAGFSSYGPGLDLLAPGVDVWTTFMTYAAASAQDAGVAGVDRETGSGRLDLAAALALVSPDIGIWHDELAADTFEPLDIDTLTIGEPGFGGADRAGRFAGVRRVRASATFVLPDSFRGPVRVWPRIGGTTTLRDGFRLETIVPWAEVVETGERRFTLRGYVYQLDATGNSEPSEATESHLPLPLDQVRFGFTVLGAVTRPPVTAAPSPAATPVRPHGFASPNPFRGAARITVPGARAIEIWDVSGRRVRRLNTGGTVGAFTWNGADDHGRIAGPGIYLVRMRPQRDSAPLKLLKLE